MPLLDLSPETFTHKPLCESLIDGGPYAENEAQDGDSSISKLIKFPGFLVTFALRAAAQAGGNTRVIFDHQDVNMC